MTNKLSALLMLTCFATIAFVPLVVADPCDPGSLQAGPCAIQKANEAGDKVKEIDPSQAVADTMATAMEKKEWAVDTADAPGRVQFALDAAGDGIGMVTGLKAYAGEKVDWGYGLATGAVCNQLGQGRCQGLIPVLP